MIRPSLFAAAALAALASTARAQVGPSPFPTGGGPTGGEEPKHEGVAEAAPKTPGLLPTTPTLPPQKSRRKRLQVLELGGYLRVRSNWFKNFNLGFSDGLHADGTSLGGAPFPRPLGCNATSTTPVRPCGNSLSDLDMRLRLEPVVNIDETTSVHAQIDMLDNQILGATPEGTFTDGTPQPGNIPLGAFAGNIVAPTAGQNAAQNSVVVKSAWAEVGTPLGVVMFGRMPDHWGLGIVHNGGGEDPINGGYDLDADYGDSVDRVSFSAQVPGTRLKAMVAADFPNSRLVSPSTSAQSFFGGTGRQSGQAIDLQDEDDVSQYSIAVSRTDTPTEFKDALERGQSVLNWGVYAQQRTQDWDYSPASVTTTPVTQFGNNTSPDPNQLVQRGYKTYVVDPWIKFGVGNWLLEAEAVGAIGSIDNISDLCQNEALPCYTGKVNIYQFGGVARATYTGVEGKLRVGIETGYASGDQYDGEDWINGKLTTVAGETNIAHARLLPAPGDDNITQMIFSRDYKIDLILFRHLLGAVTNALYFRPRLEYDLSKSFVFRVWNVTSFAARPVATPGNGAMYGLEFDGELGYQSSSFFAGFDAGALFPLGAMAHPADQSGNGTGFGYDATLNQGDAGTAYTIQMKLAVKF